MLKLFASLNQILSVKGYPRTPDALSIGFAMNEAELKTYRKDILEKINRYRFHHQAEDVVLDDAINAFAQEWATQLAKNNKLEHRPPGTQKYGECLYFVTNLKTQDAVKAWYDEVKTVDWKNLEKPDALHFTQLVWKASKKLGIGIGKSGEGFYYLVANFDPPGNYPGQFNDNVKPKKV